MKTLNLLWIALLSGMLFSSCNNDDIQPISNFQLGESFELAFDETAHCVCGDLSVTFADVVGESRCPIGAVCVWQGQAEVKINLKHEGNLHVFSLISQAGNRELARDTIGNLVVELLDVKPYPILDQPVDEDDYRIELIIVELP